MQNSHAQCEHDLRLRSRLDRGARPLRQGEGINSVAYEGAKVVEQQRQAYPDVAALTVGLAPDVAFARALDTAQRMGWTIVASDKPAGLIEAS
jgi:hypothetical protein